MKEVTLYKCDYCGMTYEDIKSCEDCENFHYNVDSATYEYDPKSSGIESQYPSTVILTMADDKKIVYKRWAPF